MGLLEIIINQQKIMNLSMSSQGNRNDPFNITQHHQRRAPATAEETRKPQNLFTSEEMQNMKLNNLRSKRRQLESKLQLVSNRINFKKKREEQELRKFIRSEEKSIALIETHNYKKFNEVLKDELSQKKTFQLRKKAKEVEDSRVTTNRRLSLIYQAVKDKKNQECQKVRQLKKVDEELIKYSKDMAFSHKKQQHEAISRMKERQVTKKKCYWLEKRMNFQQKMFDQAQIYEKQIQDYYRKIQNLKQNEQKLREQEEQANELLKCAQQNYQLLRQS